MVDGAGGGGAYCVTGGGALEDGGGALDDGGGALDDAQLVIVTILVLLTVDRIGVYKVKCWPSQTAPFG